MTSDDQAATIGELTAKGTVRRLGLAVLEDEVPGGSRMNLVHLGDPCLGQRPLELKPAEGDVGELVLDPGTIRVEATEFLTGESPEQFIPVLLIDGEIAPCTFQTGDVTMQAPEIFMTTGSGVREKDPHQSLMACRPETIKTLDQGVDLDVNGVIIRPLTEIQRDDGTMGGTLVSKDVTKPTLGMPSPSEQIVGEMKFPLRIQRTSCMKICARTHVVRDMRDDRGVARDEGLGRVKNGVERIMSADTHSLIEDGQGAGEHGLTRFDTRE